MQALARRCGIQNTDLRYYRDKYLSILFIFTMLGAIAVFSDWPLSHDELVRGEKLLAVAVICVAFLPYRLIAIGALLAFAAARLFWGAIIFRWWEGFVFGSLAGATALLLILGRLAFKGDYSIPYRFEPYSVAEIAVDTLAFLVILGLLHELLA